MHAVRFLLRSRTGTPVAHYIAEPLAQLAAPRAVSPTVGHLILVVDRSGSMYGTMTEMKTLLVASLGAQSVLCPGLLVTLLSYSSAGDYTVHFVRSPVETLGRPDSNETRQVLSLRATAMTCASEALALALSLVEESETTAITLHTDGWFNDRSPALERRAIDAFMANLRKKSNVLLNTIAHGSYVDVPTLDAMANAGSGKLVQAPSVRAVVDAMADTAALLNGRTSPPLHLAAVDGDEMQVAVNLTQQKVNGTTTDLLLRGVGGDDRVVGWRYRKVSEVAFAASSAALVAGPDADYLPVYAFCRAKLAEGRLGACKQALLATGDAVLIAAHQRALTAEDRAAFAAGLDGRLYGSNENIDRIDATTLVVRPPLLALCDVLGTSRAEWTLDLPAFLTGYRKRGLKRVSGLWTLPPVVDGDGVQPLPVPVFSKEPLRLVSREDATMLSIGRFKLNNDTASINMLVSQPADLVDDTGKRIPQVAGVKLDLRQSNNYTLVGDGALNARSLPIRVQSLGLWRALTALQAVSGPFVPGARTEIDLTQHAVADEVECPPPVDTFVAQAVCTMVVSFCRAMGVGPSVTEDDEVGTLVEGLTPAQVEALAAVHLSPRLNFSPPTTTPYWEKTQAVAEGLVDSRVGIVVERMSDTIAGLSALPSANAFFDRRFVVCLPKVDETGALVAGGGLVETEKAKLQDLRTPGVMVKEKVLSKRIVLTGIDALLFPLFCGLLTHWSSTGYTGANGAFALSDLLKSAGVAWAGEGLGTLRGLCEARLEALRAADRPWVFAIGATGALPDAWGDLPALDGEALMTAYPGLKLSKAQKENGTFFVLDRVQGQCLMILGVYPETTWFSTPLGVEVAKGLMKGADTDVA